MGNTFRQEDDGKYPLPKGSVSPGRGGSAPAGKFGLGRGSFGETLGRKMTGPINLSLKTQFQAGVGPTPAWNLWFFIMSVEPLPGR